MAGYKGSTATAQASIQRRSPKFRPKIGGLLRSDAASKQQLGRMSIG
jgi:hypothetical protein